MQRVVAGNGYNKAEWTGGRGGGAKVKRYASLVNSGNCFSKGADGSEWYRSGGCEVLRE